jgi:hypothetical protein
MLHVDLSDLIVLMNLLIVLVILMSLKLQEHEILDSYLLYVTSVSLRDGDWNAVPLVRDLDVFAVTLLEPLFCFANVVKGVSCCSLTLIRNHVLVDHQLLIDA